MINLPVPAKIGKAMRREMQTIVGCQGLGKAKVSELMAENLDDGGGVRRPSKIRETRPSRQTISVGQVLPSLTREQVSTGARKREFGHPILDQERLLGLGGRVQAALRARPDQVVKVIGAREVRPEDGSTRTTLGACQALTSSVKVLQPRMTE